MLVLQLCLACLALATPGMSQAISIFDTRADYVPNKESDVPELNFATLDEDQKSDLPDQFTVCASNFLVNKVSELAWVEILKEDFTHWFYISSDFKNIEKDTESIVHRVWINVNGAYSYLSDFGSLRFNRWFHL